ncbi:MAG: hypothetical protein K2Y39_08785 [Candidatus Obscuribacterales bacterium]|nr:hypothetical protein [Candidatus Obscuribacterales bacterium]
MEGDLGYWLPVGLVAAAASALTLYSAWNRKGRGRYLCDDCRFNNPADCLKVERPKAVTCTSYRTGAQPARAEFKKIDS